MRSRHATISPYLASTSRRGSSYAAAVRVLSAEHQKSASKPCTRLLGISGTWSCWVALSLGRNCPHNPTIGLGRAEPSSFTGIRNCIPFPFPHRLGVRRLWAHHGVEVFAVDRLSRPGTRLDGAQRSRRAASRKWVSLGGRSATLWCASTS